jgi:glucokinase
MILAGDIGATRTRMAAFQAEANKLAMVVEKTFKSQEHSGIAEIISAFVQTEGIPVHTACFGVAGPVQLRLNSVGLINDLEAYAYGIDALESKDFVTLSEGTGDDAEGNRVVIAARTGLGVAGLYWDGFRHHPFPCEGGHSDFAPKSDLEAELAHYLRERHEHVSCERILSGPGLKNIYEFLRDTQKADEPDWLKRQISQAPDQPALISQLALEKKVAICDQALDIFVGVYGSETGNCALNFLATGGVFVGGNIAAKIAPRMREPIFMNSFLNKGRMRSVLADIPVKIVSNDNCGIIGAARYTLIQKAFKNPTRASA